LRDVLARDVRATDLTIANEPSGAPYAELVGVDRLPWSLSISHRDSYGFAAVALDPSVSVGADLEMIAPRAPALVRTFFTEREADLVTDDPEGEVALARIWSAKEAALKVLGLGLRLDTRRLAVSDDVGGHRSVPAPWRPLSIAIAGSAEDRALVPLSQMQAVWRRDDDHVLTLATTARHRRRENDPVRPEPLVAPP